jgi:hypothetical protein
MLYDLLAEMIVTEVMEGIVRRSSTSSSAR